MKTKHYLPGETAIKVFEKWERSGKNFKLRSVEKLEDYDRQTLKSKIGLNPIELSSLVGK